MKFFYIIPVVFSVAACTSGQDISHKGRMIGLSHSVPVSSSAFVKDINSIIKKQDFSYVSLAITKPEDKKLKSSPLPRTIEVTTGSGFVVDTKGHIVTAAHVGVSRGWHVIATGPQGKRYQGRVVAIQRIGDMALIKLNKPVLLKPIKPIKDPCIAPGSSIISIGKPGLRQDIARVGTLTKLRFAKSVRYSKYGYNEAMVLKLQTRQGESGGPVFDHSGAFLGMIVSTLSSAAGTHPDIAHAIPTPAIGRFICSNTNCLPGWRNLNSKKLSACPAPVIATAHAN